MIPSPLSGERERERVRVRGQLRIVSSGMVKRIKKKVDNTRNQKGEIAEKIVTLLHEQSGIAVERNIWLQTKDGKDKREIDVLISGSIAGYPVRLAIECKNYHKPIEKKDIDAFVGKLNDLSFPTQQGIFVCTSRYTEGAIKRASSAGIRTLYNGPHF